MAGLRNESTRGFMPADAVEEGREPYRPANVAAQPEGGSSRAYNRALAAARSSGSSPGSIIRLDAVSEKLCEEWFPYSTHNYNLADAIELGKFYGNLPPFAVIYGIEGKNFGYGTELSEEIHIRAGRKGHRKT